MSDVHASQLHLGLHADEQAVAEAVTATLEKISYERSKSGKKHQGRMSMPEYLPVVETVIEPDEDVTGMTLIGREQTDELELNPASLYVKRTTRPKYAAPMPKRSVDKLLAATELLTTITVDKHVHHVPIDRQLKRYSMLGVDIPASTAESWQHHVAELLQPLHAALKTVMRGSCYLQVDETGLAVQDRTRQGTTHKGFLWGYHAPLLKAVFFDYRKGRGQELEHTQPRSPIGKAIRYAVRLWDHLMAYLYNGHLEIDNNLMENAIRPIALGRKNWLFAGSHDAAQNIAMYRSLSGTCQLNGINPNH